MLEPLLTISEDKYLLDVVLEMEMEDTLNHPVIVEVLNVVSEGKYSVDSSIPYLLNTFQAFVELSVTDNKGISDRLNQNIKSFSQPLKNQSRLHFHVWKFCL